MTEETRNADETPNDKEAKAPQKIPKTKRDIIHFGGEKPTAVNLEHVTTMYLDGKRLTFEFYTKSQFVDFLDEDAAKSAFKILMNTWAGDV